MIGPKNNFFICKVVKALLASLGYFANELKQCHRFPSTALGILWLMIQAIGLYGELTSPTHHREMLPEGSCVSVCPPPQAHACNSSFRDTFLGAPPHAFSPFRLKLNSKRNQLVRELEEATRQVAALHSQLKR